MKFNGMENTKTNDTRFCLMFWNEWDEALLFGYTSQFFFDTEEAALKFAETISHPECKSITIDEYFGNRHIKGCEYEVVEGE